MMHGFAALGGQHRVWVADPLKPIGCLALTKRGRFEGLERADLFAAVEAVTVMSRKKECA
jgi:hypothetical protein